MTRTGKKSSFIVVIDTAYVTKIIRYVLMSEELNNYILKNILHGFGGNHKGQNIFLLVYNNNFSYSVLNIHNVY